MIYKITRFKWIVVIQKLAPSCERLWVAVHIFLGASVAWLCQWCQNTGSTPMGKCDPLQTSVTSHRSLSWQAFFTNTSCVYFTHLSPAQWSKWTPISSYFWPLSVWVENRPQRATYKQRWAHTTVEHQELCEQRKEGVNAPAAAGTQLNPHNKPQTVNFRCNYRLWQKVQAGISKARSEFELTNTAHNSSRDAHKNTGALFDKQIDWSRKRVESHGLSSHYHYICVCVCVCVCV